MTSKEKAKELVSKYFNDAVGDTDYGWLRSIQCALIAVDEIIEQWEYVNTYLADLDGELNPNLIFWYEVKKEIEAL